jgi:hypothetical protein
VDYFGKNTIFIEKIIYFAENFVRKSEVRRILGPKIPLTDPPDDPQERKTRRVITIKTKEYGTRRRF